MKNGEHFKEKEQRQIKNEYLLEVEGQCKISSIQALKLQYAKAIPLVLLAVITVVPIILLLNFKKVRRYFIYSSCDFEEADHLFVYAEEGTYDLVALQDQNNMKTFTFQQLKYQMNGANYVPLVLDYQKYLNDLDLNQIIKTGLYQQQFLKSKQIYGLNTHHVQIENYFSYMLGVIFQPLYILQYVVVLSLTAQGLPLFGIILVVASLITTSGNYIALYLGKKKIREMATKSELYSVLRNGKFIQVQSQFIVPGDIIQISKQSKLACDCVLIQGQTFVDQSSLTGQNVPIKKNIYQINFLGRQNWLYDGTKILEAKDSLAVVVFTGFSSKKGRLLRKILYRVTNQPDFFMKMFYFLLESFLVAMSLYGATLPIRLSANISKYIVALRVLDYIVSSVPPAFPVYFTIAYSWSLYRLKKKQIYSTMPQKTVESNRLKSVCFDKTGTLTINQINLKDICMISTEGIKNVDLKQQSFPQIAITKKLFGTCHSVRKINGRDMGDEVDLKMFSISTFKLANTNSGSLMTFSDQNNNQFEVLVMNQFESRFQSMSVFVKQVKTDKHFIFVKGAPQKIHSFSVKKIQNFDQIISEMSFKGLRVIAFGWKAVEKNKVNAYIIKNRDEYLKNIQLLGVVSFNNALKQDTVRTIQTLHKCQINTRMITGDNIFVAVQIALQSGIINEDEPVLIVSGTKNTIKNGKKQFNVLQIRKNNGKISKIERNYSLNEIKRQNFSIAIDNDFLNEQNFVLDDKMRVFARILPENKAKIVTMIKEEFEQNYSQKRICTRVFGEGRGKVGMVGDGANDLMAIKEADVGVGFNGTDAVFSSAFTVNSLQDFIYVIKQGKCTTSSILECLRFTLIANYINLVVEILLSTEATFISQTQGIYLNFLIIILIPIIISLTHPHQQLLPAKVKDNFLGWQNQILVWVNIIILTAGIIGCYLYITLSPDFIPNPKPVWEIGVGYNPECQLVTIIFLAEGLLLSSLGWIISQGYPFKESLFRNIALLIVLVLNFAAFTVYFFILNPSGLGFLNLVPMQIQRTGICFAILIGSISIAFLFSLFVHKRTYDESQQRLKNFKVLNSTNNTFIQLSDIKKTQQNQLEMKIIQ